MVVQPNDVVGGFQFSKAIGEGSTGSVWLAREQTTDVPVSIKLLKVEKFPPSSLQEIFDNLTATVERAGKLTHQGLALVRRPLCAPELGVYGLVSELLEGPTLDEIPIPRAANGRGPADARTTAGVLAWFQQLAAALAWLHTNGHVHGDLKAKNVVLLYGRERPHPKLTDLCWSLAGIPKHVPETLPRAPEQQGGEPPTPLSDQWCAAKLLRDVIVGAAPSEAPEEVLAAASPRLVQVIGRGLAHDPKQRFRDMGGFFYAIEHVKNELEALASAEPAKAPADWTHDTHAAPTAMMEAIGTVKPNDPTQPVRIPRGKSDPRTLAGPRARALGDLALVDVPEEPFSDVSTGDFVDLLPRRPGAPEDDPNKTEAIEAVSTEARTSAGSQLVPLFIAAVLAAALSAGAVMLWFRDRGEITQAPTRVVSPPTEANRLPADLTPAPKRHGPAPASASSTDARK